jgi:hypothetical protein
MSNKFDDMLFKHISESDINTGEEIIHNKSSDDRYSSGDINDGEIEISAEDMEIFKQNAKDYCNLTNNITSLQHQIKGLNNELSKLQRSKYQKTRLIMPFMIKNEIDSLETEKYNLEVKYTSKMEVLSKDFILTKLKEFIDNDEIYTRFINYLMENRTRTRVSRLDAVVPKELRPKTQCKKKNVSYKNKKTNNF